MKYKLKFNRYFLVIAIPTIVIVVLLLLFFCYFRPKMTESYWQETETRYQNGQYQSIIDSIKNKELPDDADKINIYAHSYLATGQLDKSYSAYEKIYNQNSSLDARLIMANIKMEQGKKDDAEKIYLEIIQKNSSFIQAYLNLSNLYRSDGKLEKAIDTLKQANRVNPSNTELIKYYLAINTENKDTQEYKDWSEKLNNILNK